MAHTCYDFAVPSYLLTESHIGLRTKKVFIPPRGRLLDTLVTCPESNKKSIIVVGCLPSDLITVVFEGDPNEIVDKSLSNFSIIKELRHGESVTFADGFNGMPMASFIVRHQTYGIADTIVPEGDYDWQEIISIGRENIQPL